MHLTKAAVSLVAALFALPTAAMADNLILTAAKDNTLIEAAVNFNSNGAGPSFYSGNTTRGAGVRRGLLQFDLSGIPAGAVITDATLTLHMTKSVDTAARDYSLFALGNSWGEGTSSGLGNGSPATADDATWVSRFFNVTPWATAGGEFAAGASATASVDGVGTYAWHSAQLLADVQAWQLAPGANFGWILIGGEAVSGSAREFASRENVTASLRPTLSLTFATVPEPATLMMFLPAVLWVRGRRAARIG